MKKFALLTVGFEKPTSEIMNAWMSWFQNIQDNIDEQVGFMNGKEITKTGMRDLPMDLNAITGCLFIKAKDMEEAVNIARGCPLITSTRVYEIRNHKG